MDDGRCFAPVRLDHPSSVLKRTARPLGGWRRLSAERRVSDAWSPSRAPPVLSGAMRVDFRSRLPHQGMPRARERESVLPGVPQGTGSPPRDRAADGFLFGPVEGVGTPVDPVVPGDFGAFPFAACRREIDAETGAAALERRPQSVSVGKGQADPTPAQTRLLRTVRRRRRLVPPSEVRPEAVPSHGPSQGFGKQGRSCLVAARPCASEAVQEPGVGAVRSMAAIGGRRGTIGNSGPAWPVSACRSARRCSESTRGGRRRPWQP